MHLRTYRVNDLPGLASSCLAGACTKQLSIHVESVSILEEPTEVHCKHIVGQHHGHLCYQAQYYSFGGYEFEYVFGGADDVSAGHGAASARSPHKRWTLPCGIPASEINDTPPPPRDFVISSARVLGQSRPPITS